MMLYRYVVTTFNERDVIDTAYTDDEGNTRMVRVKREVEEAENNYDSQADWKSGMFFFPIQEEAVEFAQVFAAKYPGNTAAISEIQQVFVSEKPKVIGKLVNEKGVLPA